MKILLFLKKIPLARYVNFLIIAIIVFSAFNNKYWKQKDGIIHWDIIDYYGYLPATFIYKDVTCKFINNPPADYTGIIWAHETKTDCRVMKMTMGISILYSPFFFIANSLAKPLGYKPDGYSIPYRFAIAMSCIAYLFVGLYFLRKVLERFFSQWIIAITLFSIVICTNLIHYTIQEAGMSHVFNFTLFSIFLFLIIKWHEKPSLFYSISIGLIGGLISLIRPTNIIVFFIFILYGCLSIKDVKERILFFIKSYKKILIISFFVFLVWLPQFLYWKATTGQYLFYSYGDEYFFFNNPHIISGLFGYRGGWLLYSPIMIFSIIGFLFLKKNLKPFCISLSVFLFINVYVILSWWCWWYTGLGTRAFIESYAFLAIPLAAFIQWALYNKRILLKVLFLFLVLIFNIFGVYHVLKYHYGSLHFSSMTQKAYWQSFGKLRPDGNFYYLLRQPDYEKAKLGKE